MDEESVKELRGHVNNKVMKTNKFKRYKQLYE